MADTDEEQIEAIKKWWDENGTSLIVGVVLALGGVFGYQAWQNQVQQTGEAASALYEDMMAAVTVDSPFETLDEESVSTGKFVATQLKDDYTDTVYAHFAALQLARLAVDAGDLDTAKQELEWSLANGVDDALEPLVELRLARVELAMDDPAAALARLESIEPGEYRVSWEELKGDVLLAEGRTDEAREAYQRAVNALPEDEPRQMLRMKLEDLVVPQTVVPVAAAADPVADETAEPTESPDGES